MKMHQQVRFHVRTGTFYLESERLSLEISSLCVQLQLTTYTVTDNIGNRNNLLEVPECEEPPTEEQPTVQAGATIGTTTAHEPATTNGTTMGDTHVQEVNSNSHETEGEPEAHIEKKHELRLQDAEEYVLVKKGSRSPELAAVAAEVADTAAGLDREQPTPPISDEEAGRIGFRRLSRTPIPQVALTAAEVADVAAKLDKAELVGLRAKWIAE